MLVPDDNYTPDLLKEKPLDKSSEFSRLCGAEGFSIQYVHTSAGGLLQAQGISAKQNSLLSTLIMISVASTVYKRKLVCPGVTWITWLHVHI